jgi:hypothetical protein
MTPCSPPSRIAVARWPRLDGVWLSPAEDGVARNGAFARTKNWPKGGIWRNTAIEVGAPCGCMRRCHRHKVQLRARVATRSRPGRPFPGMHSRAAGPANYPAGLMALGVFRRFDRSRFCCQRRQARIRRDVCRVLASLSETDGSMLGILSGPPVERFCFSLPRNRCGVGMGYPRSSW